MDSDLESEDWHVISAVDPTPKSRVRNPGLPCPEYSRHPRIPALHRLHPVFPELSAVAPSFASHPSSSFASHAPDVEPTDHIDSLLRVDRPFGGKPLPTLNHATPSSLLPADMEMPAIAPGQPSVQLTKQCKTQPSKRRPVTCSRVVSSSHKEDMIRIRQPSNSPIIQKLVETFMVLFTPLSQLLLDLESSMHGLVHVYRIIDGYAATTIIKYLSALIAFHRTCMDLRVDISTLTSVTLADVIVAANLSRRSDGSGPSHSVLIKAIRWGYRNFNISSLAIAFDDIISSFYRTKIPRDRRESLPFSLYILTQFERRVLQSSTPDGEAIIIGAFLFLLWSGFRWSDMQRTAPSTLQWSGNELRGLAWRTKTSSAGCPFGFVACGFFEPWDIFLDS